MSQSEIVSRRTLLKTIGVMAGTSMMYQAMVALGHANESGFNSPLKLENAPKGTRVVILGAGLAGLVSAYELTKAGYNVQIIEFNNRSGGRSWSIRGDDKYTELGGFAQQCKFDTGLYFNAGPWRVPYHHHGYLHYAREFNVKIEPFNAVNGNALIHSSKFFGGKPQRYRQILSDYVGQTSELFAKAVNVDALDNEVDQETKEKLLESLKGWGLLDKDYRYTAATATAVRGFKQDPNAISNGIPNSTIKLDDILNAQLWQTLNLPFSYEYGPITFEPVGGMDQLPKALTKALGNIITYNARVTKIIQTDDAVQVTYQDVANNSKETEVSADYCVCTIPFSILSQLQHNFCDGMEAGIQAVPYAPSFKAGIQFKRRFWEEDEAIFGGITFTDLPIGQMSYPSTDYLSRGKGVILGAYLFGVNAFEFSSLTPDERLEKTMDSVVQIHPQAKKEFDNGVTVAWHRSPFSLGCYGLWTDETRAQHFSAVSTMDRRVVLAGEHISYLPAWQEGSIESAVHAVNQLHQRAVQRGS